MTVRPACDPSRGVDARPRAAGAELPSGRHTPLGVGGEGGVLVDENAASGHQCGPFIGRGTAAPKGAAAEVPGY